MESGRLILRDGTTALIRLAQPDDREALRTFFEQRRQNRDSGGSFRRRSRAANGSIPCVTPSTRASSSPSSSSAPPGTTHHRHGLLPHRAREGPYGRGRPGGRRRLPRQGGRSLLLERLALLAVRHGITHFWAPMGTIVPCWRSSIAPAFRCRRRSNMVMCSSLRS